MASSRERKKVFEVVECGSAHGVGMQVAALCRHLDHDEFEIWVIYATRPGCTPREFEQLTREADAHRHVPSMVRQLRPLKDIRALWELYQLMRDERPTVVHAHSSKAGVLARIAAFLAGVPRIYYSPHGYSFLQSDVSVAARAAYWGIELVASSIGTIVSTSQGEAGLARNLSWRKPVYVVPNLFDWDEVTPDAPREERPDELVIGALGRLTAARRPEAFVRLADRLGSRYKSVRFVWIGGGEQEASIRHLAAATGLGSRLEFTGHISRDELTRRLRQMDVFVHFSLWEGSPVSIMEAMHLGKPVVASRIRGNADLVADGVTGYLVADEDDLVERITRLIDSPELRRRMGAASAMRLKQDFSLENSVRRIQSLYVSGAITGING